VAAEELRRDLRGALADVIAVELGVRRQGEQEVERAVPAMEAELDHHARAQHAHQREEQQGFVPLDGAAGGFLLEEPEMAELGCGPSGEETRQMAQPSPAQESAAG